MDIKTQARYRDGSGARRIERGFKVIPVTASGMLARTGQREVAGESIESLSDSSADTVNHQRDVG